jgi:dipeptidase E
MKKLFLSAYFSTVAKLLPKFTDNSCSGKNVLFIPTASLTEKLTFYVDGDKKALIKLGMIVNDLELTKVPKDEIIKKIENTDYIFVAGGNTFFLLQEMRRLGVDKLILEHINKGKIYIGSSAGSVILSKNIEFVKYMDNPAKAKGLNNDFSAISAIDFYILPHYKNFPFIKATKKTVLEYKNKIDLRPINNKQVIVVNDNKIETLMVK